MSTYAALTNPANLIFYDEFQSFTWSADGSVGWQTCYPYGAGNTSSRYLGSINNEQEYYTDSTVGPQPFICANSVLEIQAFPITQTPSYYGKSTPTYYGGIVNSAQEYAAYFSGVITTYGSLQFQCGYAEIRCRLPPGDGFWPAFWLYAANHTAEIDIFEVWFPSGQDVIHFTATNHSTGAGTSHPYTVSDPTAAFHTYGCEWTPTVCNLWIDGVLIGSVPTPATANQNLYLIVDLAIGTGGFAGAPNASTYFPAGIEIDYVRVYATPNTVSATGTALISAGLTNANSTAGLATYQATANAQNQTLKAGANGSGYLAPARVLADANGADAVGAVGTGIVPLGGGSGVLGLLYSVLLAVSGALETAAQPVTITPVTIPVGTTPTTVVAAGGAGRRLDGVNAGNSTIWLTPIGGSVSSAAANVGTEIAPGASVSILAGTTNAWEAIAIGAPGTLTLWPST